MPALSLVAGPLLFFKHHLWTRLIVNIGVVLVFTAFYLRYQHALRGK
jgi:hypothetical protein